MRAGLSGMGWWRRAEPEEHLSLERQTLEPIYKKRRGATEWKREGKGQEPGRGILQ